VTAFGEVRSTELTVVRVSVKEPLVPVHDLVTGSVADTAAKSMSVGEIESASPGDNPEASPARVADTRIEASSRLSEVASCNGVGAALIPLPNATNAKSIMAACAAELAPMAVIKATAKAGTTILHKAVFIFPA
jgi:hypothetical protein